MNRQDNSKAPRNMPTILIRSDEFPQNEPKKILRPKSIDDLKSKAIKLFKLQNPIVSIYDEHGYIMVNDIYDIIAGRTYLISSIKPSKNSQKGKSIFTKNKKTTNKDQTKPVKTYNLNDSDDSYSDDIMSFPSTPKTDQEKNPKESQKKKKSFLPIYHGAKHIISDVDHDEEIANEGGYYTEHDNDDENKNYYITTTSSEVLLNENTEKVQDEKFNEEEKEGTKDENSVVQIFNEAFPNHGLSDDIKSILHLLPPEYLDFAQSALELENQQKTRWINSLLSIATEYNLSFDEEKVNYYKDIQAKCINIIKDHFFATQCGVIASIKTVIDGPSSSGKTLFLSILLNQYITTLANYNMWKDNFIIILNCEDFSFYAADIRILYFHFVKVTVEHLKAQVPESIPYLSLIKKHFETIVNENYLPVLPKKFATNPSTIKLANSIKIVSNLINQSWQNVNGRESFCTLIFFMPVLIAKNLGYKDITLFVDHFDLINLEIDEMDHFPESYGELFLIDYFKNVLIQTNFVISSKDSNELWQCFQPFDENSFDLTNIVSIESTMDTNSEAKYDDQEFIFSTDNIICKINAQHFGGIPAYLTKWIELNQLMDIVDDTPKDDDDYEEKYIDVVNSLQSILPIIFTDVKKNPQIKNVQRRQKK